MTIDKQITTIKNPELSFDRIKVTTYGKTVELKVPDQKALRRFVTNLYRQQILHEWSMQVHPQRYPALCNILTDLTKGKQVERHPIQ